MAYRFFPAVVLLFCCNLAWAQRPPAKDSTFEDYELAMLVLADSMYNAFIPDTRPAFCEQFTRMLVRALKKENSFSYPFSKLQQKINILMPEDKSFRIFNWNILNTEITFRYYGAIQMNSAQLKLYPLIDHTNELSKEEEYGILTGNKWYGCLYYNIMSHEVKGEKFYTLFGVNRTDAISNKKLLDVLTMTPQGPVFGKPIFRVKNEAGAFQEQNRFIIQYKKEVQASLNYDPQEKAIIFDRLISQVNDPNRKYTYVPSGQYDGFRWNGGGWNYFEDLIPIEDRGDQNAPSDK